MNKKPFEKVRIRVNQQDIKRGKRGCYYECPISLAAARKLRKVKGTSQYYLDLFKPCGSFESCSLPDEASEFTRRFDRGGEVKPFSFDVNVPASAVITKTRKKPKRIPGRTSVRTKTRAHN